MSGSFFAPFGDRVSFQDPEDLLAKLRLIDAPVSDRIKGRRSHHRERWCVVRYLVALNDASMLQFPVDLRRGDDPPDFFLKEAGSSEVALEHTDAGTQKHQRAITELEKQPGSHLEGEDSLVAPGDRLIHPGYTGNEAERKWASLLLNHIESKTKKLNEPHVKVACKYDLLLYDSTHLLLADFEEAGALLYSLVDAWRERVAFRRRFSAISLPCYRPGQKQCPILSESLPIRRPN